MKLLNRSGVALVPKTPFVEWSSKLVDEPLNNAMSASEHRQEGTVYMFDEVETEQDFSAAVLTHWQKMFENELSAWDEFGDTWPNELSYDLFLQWFDVYPQVSVFDVLDEPIMTAKLD